VGVGGDGTGKKMGSVNKMQESNGTGWQMTVVNPGKRKGGQGEGGGGGGPAGKKAVLQTAGWRTTKLGKKIH